MKLWLIQPPIQDFYDTDIRLQPIGLAYLKAALLKAFTDVEVTIKDYHQGWGRKTVPIPKELAYLKEYYAVADKSPFSTFSQYYHFGAPFETIAEELAAGGPDLVGIASLFSPYYREALACAKMVKETLGVPVLMGGSHVSAMPEQILQSPHVDFIIRGEGERAIVQFLRAFRTDKNYRSVVNLGYKKEGRLILNPIEENDPIDELALPDLSDFEPRDYLFENRPVSFIITSRSCPHRCTFCSVHKTFGFQYRRRSVKNVLTEINLRTQQGIRVIDFEDDNLTFYKDEMKELCREIIRNYPPGALQFVAMNGISYLSLDAELLKLMKQAGFTHLNLALVSSDVTVRETTKRPHTLVKYLDVVKEGHALGFNIVSYQILGLPSETLDSMIQTLLFAAQLPVLLGASLFYLTPNSPIARNFPPPTDEEVFKSRLTAMAIETEHAKREDLYTLFITTRIINFIKGFPCGNVDLFEALEQAKQIDRRHEIGAELLLKLFSEKCLYTFTRNGLVPNRKFKIDLFFNVWGQLDVISTQSGSHINHGDDASNPKPTRSETKR